jgi:hypothetical protein
MTSLRAANVRGHVFTVICQIPARLYFSETTVSWTWQFMVKRQPSCRSGKKTWFLCWYIVVMGSYQCWGSGLGADLKKTWKFKNRHDDFDFKRILRSFYFISFSKFWDVFCEIKVEGAQKSKMPLYVQCTVHSVWGSTFFKNKAIYSFIFYRYQKIRLRAFIPKMQTYLIEKMHLYKIILKKQKIF